MKTLPKILILSLIIFLILLAIFIHQTNKKINPVCVNLSCLDVEIATTQEQQELGLMFRKNLSGGMLFIYDQEQSLSFWMKNTIISLDIIWINSNLEIVAIEQANPCSDSCQIYTHSGKYVLEVSSNFTIDNNIRIGDTAKFQKE